MFSTRSHLGLLAPLILALPGFAAEAPLQVGRPFPAFLDLKDADAGPLVPNDTPDSAPEGATQMAGQTCIVLLKQEPTLRLSISPPNRKKVP